MGNTNNARAKKAQRDELERLADEYLKRGGKVTEYPFQLRSIPVDYSFHDEMVADMERAWSGERFEHPRRDRPMKELDRRGNPLAVDVMMMQRDRCDGFSFDEIERLERELDGR